MDINEKRRIADAIGETGRELRLAPRNIAPPPYRHYCASRSMYSAQRFQGFDSVSPCHRFALDLSESSFRVVPLGDESELFRTRGYVWGVRKPFVEVDVEEQSEEGARTKRLLMPYELFADQGLLGQFMPFWYRIYRKGNKIISEIVPDDSSTEAGETTDDSLGRLEQIEETALRKLGFH